MRKTIKRGIVIGTALAVTTGAMAAYAAWTAQGTGNATAQAGNAKNLVITEVTTAATLYPGATGDATITIENPNTYPVLVDTIKWKPSDGVKATPVAGSTCVNTGVYFGDFSKSTIGSDGLLTGLTLELTPGQTQTFTLKNAVRMINNSENGCQGATFHIPVRVTGASNAG